MQRSGGPSDRLCAGALLRHLSLPVFLSLLRYRLRPGFCGGYCIPDHRRHIVVRRPVALVAWLQPCDASPLSWLRWLRRGIFCRGWRGRDCTCRGRLGARMRVHHFHQRWEERRQLGFERCRRAVAAFAW